jgi:[ribosomal protein S18]-alanine N-acetyltransferase
MAAIRERDWWPDPLEHPPLEGVEIIPMVMAQVDEIIIIEKESFPIPWHREAFEYDLTKNPLAHYWTVTLDGVIIGYAGFWLIDRIAHLTTMCIKGAYRGKGLGKWLLLEVMKRGAEMDAERFTLEVRETNAIAIKLYMETGYRIVGSREKYYKEINEDALIMWTGAPPYEG